MSLLDNFGHDSIAPTPSNKRSMNLFNTFALWCAAAVVITVVMVGAIMVPDLTPIEAIVIVIAGTLLGTFPMVYVGKIGTRTGLPTMVLLRAVFGQRGAALPAFVNGLIWIGWNWIQAYMAGFSLNFAVESMFGYSNINLFVVLTGVLVAVIAMYGHRGIEAMENVVAIMMIVLSMAVFVSLFTTYDVQALIELEASENPEMTRILAFDMIVGLCFAWITSVCDYNRYCKSERTGAIGTYIGYCVATIIACGLGIVVAGFAVVAGMEFTYDPTILLASTGFGPVAAIVVFLSVLSTNVMGTYTVTFSFLTIFRNVSFWKVCLLVGVISVIGALLKEVLLDYLMDYVLLIGYLFIPMFSMLLVDFYLLKKGQYDAEDIAFDTKGNFNYIGGFNIFAIVCYVVCAFGAYYFAYIEPVNTSMTLVSFFASGIIYLIGMKVFHPNESKVKAAQV